MTRVSLIAAQPEMYTSERIEKSVSMLAIVPKTGSITRVGRQAYTIMLMIAKEQGVENATTKMFGSPLRSIINGFEGEIGTATLLKSHLRSMVSHVVEWQSPSTGESAEWGACALLAEVKINKQKGENWVHWSYPPTLRQEMLDPQIYAQIQRSTIAKFRSHAAMALYENCARYKNNPSHLTSKQTWKWWMAVLTGKPLPENSKAEFRFFNRDVLKPAVDEANEVSEITVSVREFRMGRSVEFLQFEVHKKAVNEALEPVDMSSLVLARELGISDETAEKLLHKYQHGRLMAALVKLRARILSKGESLRSKSAYLKSILADEGEQEPQLSNLAEESTEPLASVVHARTRTKTDEIIESGTTRLSEIRKEIEALQTNDLAVLLSEYRADIVENAISTSQRASITKRIDEGNWQSSMVLGGLIYFYWRKTRGTEWTGHQ